jgi:hypothetical protein
MAMYLTIAVVGLAIASLLVPMLITQVRATKLDTTRVHALDAAEAGLDVMVGKIRAAQVQGTGTRSLLPCSTVNGQVIGTGSAQYTVKVDYYTLDPVAVPTAAKMRCVEGYGTYDSATDTFTPKYARITSTGTDGAGTTGETQGRTLVETYVFRTDNSNISGGRIRLNPATSSSPALCIDAGSAPVADGIIHVEACATPLIPQQTWAYRSDLSILLVSSISSTYPTGLCLDTLPPLTDGRDIELGICGPLGSPPYKQQWSYNDNGGYQGSQTNSSTTGTISPLCMTAPSQNAGVIVILGSCGSNGGSTNPTTQQWIPEPSVGAGAAMPPQIVNYYEFGRCLDVTNQQVGSSHLIDYPCKQNPYRPAITWNQKWTTPGIPAGQKSATGQIYTSYNSVAYCLTSPGTNNGYPVVAPCSSTNPKQVWTVYGGHAKLRYSAQYTIVDSNGRCLGLTSPVSGEEWSAIDVETCNGATEQKWNAPPNLSTPARQDLTEL